MAVQERDWFCYMVKCCDGSLYVGVATNVKDRVREHNQGRGAIFTAKRRPVELLWSEGHPNQLSARQCERELKGWRREKKLALASGASTVREASGDRGRLRMTLRADEALALKVRLAGKP